MYDPQAPKAAISKLIDSFGYSEARIAEEMRGFEHGLTTSQSSIHRIKNGTQTPRWDEGLAILKVLERATLGPGLAEEALASPAKAKAG